MQFSHLIALAFYFVGPWTIAVCISAEAISLFNTDGAENHWPIAAICAGHKPARAANLFASAARSSRKPSTAQISLKRFALQRHYLMTETL
jgi:hypothetical protein